jgi:predicted enzyme related to lactoylglutathione lyase
MSEHAIKGIDIHTYLIKDPARAIAFWRDTMGLQPTYVSDEQGAEFLLPDGSYFGIWKMDDGSWSEGVGLMLAVDDVPAAVEHYTAKGVKFAGHEETPVCWMAFAEDSEGNHFILHKRKDGSAGNAHLH